MIPNILLPSKLIQKHTFRCVFTGAFQIWNNSTKKFAILISVMLLKQILRETLVLLIMKL